MNVARVILLGLALLAPLLAGCGKNALAPESPPSGMLRAPDNPLFVPSVDRDLLWEQLVDTLDDYFRIERETPVRLVGNILMEGRVTTFPTIGSTYLEPWRGDSTLGFERLHSTLQSVRRWANVRVIPTDGGYLVDVTVNKELEDVDRPEHSSVSAAASLRHDGALVRQDPKKRDTANTLGWIPLGRDASLEERILVELRGRLTNLDGPQRLPAGGTGRPAPPGEVRPAGG